MHNHQKLSYGATNLVEKDRKMSQKHETSYSNWYNHHQELMRTSSPLGKNSPSPSHPLLSHQNYRSFSPNSRAEAIVRGQQELMEMVKNMPESSYELSLKDIVEHDRGETPSPQRETESSESLHQRAVAKVKREDQSKKVDRSLSFENKGLFLNMVLPFSVRPKKKNKFGGNDSVKVCPKTEGLKGGRERDWWKKKFNGSSDSDSSRISNNSGSSGSTGSGDGGSSGSTSSGDVRGRKKNTFFSVCWPFFHCRSNKPEK